MTPVGVIGAGVMGAGVAQTLAETGHQVVLVDVSDDVLERAVDEVHRNARMRALFDSGPAADPDAVVAAIRPTTDYAELAGTGFVIENATEKWAIKRDVYPRLDAACPSDTVFAANTSAIPITRLAALTGRPDRVVGIHFMNPVPLKPAVELIAGFHSSEEALERARSVLAAMGKRPIEVRDAPGFVSNRVLMLTVNEAAFVVHEGTAEAEQVDDVFRSCFGHPMGPLELADLIGLDTILYSIEVLHDSFADSKYRPCPLLRKLVDAGLHGRKSGRGFYQYETGLAPTEGGSVAHAS
ncbi:MAG TPA: 3-hydroxyacyl-CoA dehydrogenase NAD-binding domain-containing protein [Solirubrobacteraceae bacterium]|nr:3-hydroxyacyl-CoA dehydrogenase NAD-binding domain-containing protein [Solirubrobacteraceae bacterium]